LYWFLNGEYGVNEAVMTPQSGENIKMAVFSERPDVPAVNHYCFIRKSGFHMGIYSRKMRGFVWPEGLFIKKFESD
jgi:hypothetical protein